MDKPHTILAIQAADSKYGIAFYDSTACQMSVGVVCGSVKHITREHLYSFAKRMPVTIILCAQNCIDTPAISALLDELDCEVVSTADSEFDFISSQRRIFSAVGNLTGSEAGISVSVDSSLDQDTILANQLSIGCAGALLEYVRANHQDGVRRASITVHVATSVIKQHMTIDTDAQSYIQIFDEKIHPNMHSPVRNGEGKSLYGVLNKTASVGGQEMLASWIRYPLQALDDILARQEAVAFFVDTSNSELLSSVRKILNKARPVRTACMRISTEILLSDLELLSQFAYTVVKLHQLLSPIDNLPALISKFTGIDESVFVNLGSLIISMVNFDLSRKDGRVVIQSGISSKVDYLRQKFNNLDNTLAEASCEMEAEAHVPVVAVYFPQLGFLSSIDIEHFVDSSLEQDLDGWSLKFQTDMQRYYKNGITSALDSTFGDIYCLLVDAESEVGLNLQNDISEWIGNILQASDMLSQIDCIQSLATVARLYGYCQPQLCTSNCIHIEQGRHPILDSTLENAGFIANSIDLASSCCPHYTAIGSEPRQMIVLMGPNGSGKSVVIKQAALLVYMAHIGSHIPARRAMIGIFNCIHIVGNSTESLIKQMSSFSADLYTVANMMQAAKSGTLILLDEFGRGTNPVSGASMLCGLLKSLCRDSENCPLVIAATHFQEIRSIECISDIWQRAQIKSMEYQETLSGIVHMFRMTDRVPKQYSYAIACAKNAGIPSHILARAQKYI